MGQDGHGAIAVVETFEQVFQLSEGEHFEL